MSDEQTQEDEIRFAHTPEYQLKVLAYMTHDLQFCKVAGATLTGADFGDKARQWFFNELATAQPQHTFVTLKESMIRAAHDKIIKKEELDKFVNTYKHLREAPLPVEKERIKGELTVFMQTQALKRVLLNGWDYVQKGKFGDILNDVKEAVSSGMDLTDMGYDYFGTTVERGTDRVLHEDEKKLLTGIPSLDTLLNGGVKLKQLLLAVGGTGRGKSIFLQWLGRTAILCGKTVVYITLELSKEDIALRHDAMFARIKINELKSYNDEFIDRIEPMAAKYGRRLWIKELIAGKSTVHDIEAYLSLLAGQGIKPDLVLVDYLDLLRCHTKSDAKWDRLEDITTALFGLAKEFETRIATATQMNKLGFSMENPDETAVGGAMAKLFAPDIALFMAQTKEERLDKKIRLVIGKSRNGEAGLAISLDTDYAYMSFFDEEGGHDEIVVPTDTPQPTAKPKKTKQKEEQVVADVQQKTPEFDFSFDGIDDLPPDSDDDGDGIFVSTDDEVDMLVLHEDGTLGPPKR